MPHFRTGLGVEVERDRDVRFRRYDIPPARTAAEIRRSTTSHITDRTMRRHHRSAWCRLRDHTVLAWFVQWPGSAELGFRTAPPRAREGQRTERFSDTIFSGRPSATCGSLMMDRTRQLTPSGCRQPGPRRKRSSLGTALPCSRTGITTAVASWRRVGQRAGTQALHVVSWHGTRPPRKSARRSDRETGPRGR